MHCVAVACVSVLLFSCDKTETYQEPKDDNLSLRQLVNKYYKNSNFHIGATVVPNYLTDLNYKSLSDVFYREFSLNLVRDEFNQAVVYPQSNKEWFDGNYKHLFNLARKNKQILSIDASLSPDCSEWIKDENAEAHTIENIRSILNYYVANTAKEAQKNKDVVKWMTVIRNPVSRGHEGLEYDGTGTARSFQAGEWFGPVAGIGYELPWMVIGFTDTLLNNSNLAEPRIPNYIFEAFRLANQYAPDVKQLIAQPDGEMNDNVWTTIKELAVTLRGKGVKIDGIEWIASLDLQKGFGEEQLRKLSLLIDWCYQNNFEFHIAGLEVKSSNVNRWDTEDLDGLRKKEAEVSALITPIAGLLIEKAGKGAATLSYGVFDGRYEKGTGTYAVLFDHEGNNRQMYRDLQNTLSPDLSNN